MNWPGRQSRFLTPAAALAICGAVAPSAATELYCRSSHLLEWRDPDPAFSREISTEFWVSTESGEWNVRTIGSRARYHDGGTFDIRSDGTNNYFYWVGVSERFAETLTIALMEPGLVFNWNRRGGIAEFGTCVDTKGRKFWDGEVVE